MCIIVHNCFININETTSNPKTKQPPQQSSSTFLDGFIERKALLPSLLILCITLMYGGIGSFITLFATEVGIADISLFFLCNALAIAVTRPFSGKLYDAKGHTFVIIPGVIITFTGIILLSYTTTIPSLIIAAACYGSGFGAIQPALQAWMIDRVAPHRRGVATATFFSAFDLGIGAGAIIFGFIAHFTNYATVYRYSSLLLIAFLFIYITSIRKQKHGDKNTEKLLDNSVAFYHVKRIVFPHFAVLKLHAFPTYFLSSSKIYDELADAFLDIRLNNIILKV